jgi:hypothetical protein
VVPFTYRQIARLVALAPNPTAAVMGWVNRLLPDGSKERAAGAIDPTRGADVPLPKAVRAAIVLSERAATRNNERAAPTHPY